MRSSRPPSTFPHSPEGGNPRSPDVQQSPDDQQNRVRDAEILGRSFQVRLLIDKGVGNAISATHEQVAKFKNALSTPRNAYLRNRHEAAQEKYERKKDKVGSSHFKLMNRHHQRVADKYRGKLERKKSAFDSHTNKMQGRLDRAQGHRERHETIHSKNIDMYRDRKAMAQSSKELRKIRREHRESGKGRLEVNRIMSAITPEQRKQIGAVACRRETAVRDLQRAARRRSRAESKASGANDKLAETIASLNTTGENIAKTQKNRETASTLHNEISSNITDLENQRSQLDENNEDDQAEINRLDDEIAAEEQRLEGVASRLQMFDDRLETLKLSADRLRADVASQQTKSAELKQKAEDATASHTEQSARVTSINSEQERIMTSAPAPQPVPPPAPPATPTPPLTPPVIPTTPSPIPPSPATPPTSPPTPGD